MNRISGYWVKGTTAQWRMQHAETNHAYAELIAVSFGWQMTVEQLALLRCIADVARDEWIEATKELARR